MKPPIQGVRIVGKDYTLIPAGEGQLYPVKLGAHVSDRQEIVYSLEQHADQLRDTILHECLHGIDYAMQTRLKERQIHALATGLYAFLSENPHLVRWIIGDVK